MKISDTTIEQLLTSGGQLDEIKLSNLKKEEQNTGRNLQELVLQRGFVTSEELVKLYASFADIPYVDIVPTDVTRELLGLLPEPIARKYNAVVFKTDGNTRYLAMEDPDDVQAVDFIKKQIGNDVKLHISTKEIINRVLDNYRQDAGQEISEVISQQNSDSEKSKKTPLPTDADIAEDSPIAQTINLLLEYAVRAGASDIHVEPREDYVSVRYRIDGVLREVNRLPRNVLESLMSRVKILSNLKIDERRVPQDGRFKIVISDNRYALRVSTLPVTEGEKVVLRILDEGNRALSLEQLGYWGNSLRVINDAIIQPHGMTLVTGPTGSGKSTSLFSVLSMLNNEKVNISTIEDPVEYRIPGVNQTQVNPVAGMTFVSGLRALLRQDPNIIMVGEIRDGETANLAVQAALTGHLVFSTMHTNNAATSLPRLLDMKIEPFLIASTVRAMVGQRLVRKLCKSCRYTYKPTAAEQAELVQMFGLATAEGMLRLHTLEREAARAGIGDIGEAFGATSSGIEALWKAGIKGCDKCNHTGYKGRIGIYEVLQNSAAIQALIVGSATSDVIQLQATKEGMVTMHIDGLIKALRGETSIEETLRVTRE